MQISIHSKMLLNLVIQREIVLNEENITNRWNTNVVFQLNVEKETMSNLSDRILTPIKHHILSKGLKYGIKAKKPSTFEIMARFERLAESLNDLEINKKTTNE